MLNEQNPQTEEQGNSDTQEDGDGQNQSNELETLKAQKQHWKEKYQKLEEEYKTKKDTKAKKSNTELGYGEKAFLAANGIKGKEAMELVQEYMDNGKSLDDIVENKHFKNELKDIEEAKAVANATPSNSKRSNTQTRDTVEYWLAKGELPPASETQLRRDVVNARIKKETDGSKFTDRPVA